MDLDLGMMSSSVYEEIEAIGNTCDSTSVTADQTTITVDEY